MQVEVICNDDGRSAASLFYFVLHICLIPSTFLRKNEVGVQCNFSSFLCSSVGPIKELKKAINRISVIRNHYHITKLCVDFMVMSKMFWIKS